MWFLKFYDIYILKRKKKKTRKQKPQKERPNKTNSHKLGKKSGQP